MGDIKIDFSHAGVKFTDEIKQRLPTIYYPMAEAKAAISLVGYACRCYVPNCLSTK